jgi:hypothetical protein
MIRVHGYLGVKSNSKKHFSNIELFHANWALKFQKSDNMTKNLFFTKFEYGDRVGAPL